MSISNKLNDLSNSSIRKRFFDTEFIPENNLVIGCIRVSSKKQQRGQSITEQTEIINEYSEKENLCIVRTWEIAESASKHDERKNHNAMMNFIEQSQQTDKPIKGLVYSHQSRSNRNKESARKFESLVELGVTLHFARDKRKLTCKSDIAELMMWHMENIRNEGFIHELTQNAMGGTIRSIERGLYPSGRPPYGYKSVGRKDSRYFAFDGDKAVYMKAAFEFTGERLFTGEKFSDRELKEKLDKRFYYLDKTPSKKQFGELLRNPFYYGDFTYSGEVYKGNPDFHPPLVDKILWGQVQDVLRGRYRKKRLSKTHAYVGLVTCNGRILDDDGNLTDEICGCAVTGETIPRKYKSGKTQKFTYYRCSNAIKRCSQRDKYYMKEIVGRNIGYRKAEIEVIFQDIFKSFSFDEVTVERMKKYLWKEHFEEKKNHNHRIAILRKRYDEIINLMNQIYEDKLSKKIPEDMWQEKTNTWAIESREIENEIKSLRKHTDEYMQRGVLLIELMQHSEIIYKNASPERKRRLVELVSSNLLLSDGTIEYKWRKPFDMLAIKGDLEKWHAEQGSNLRPSA